jgi:hypothetical protein
MICGRGEVLTGPAELLFHPCGWSALPVGGCGDAIGTAYVGSPSCGGPLRAAIFTQTLTRICH